MICCSETRHSGYFTIRFIIGSQIPKFRKHFDVSSFYFSHAINPVFSPVTSIARNHKSLDIAMTTRWSSSIPGFSLSCRLKFDSSNPSTSSNTNMCSAWSLNPLIAFEISDHTAGSSALSGLRFSISIMRLGADMITSYFPSESKVTIAYTNFSPSGRCAYPGDNANTILGVTLVNDPSFVASTTSYIDSRISFIAGHTAFSADAGSLSLLRKPLLCRWSSIAVGPRRPPPTL